MSSICLLYLVKILSGGVWGVGLKKGFFNRLFQKGEAAPFGEYYIRELQVGRGQLCLVGVL